MDLSTYISDPARRAALAAAIPTSPQYLWQIANAWRGKRPSLLMAKAIERATSGVVTRSDLRPDIWPPEADTPDKREVA